MGHLQAWSGEVLTVVVVDTPAKLAALVAASGGVVAANTAALPMASYFMKPAVGPTNQPCSLGCIRGTYLKTPTIPVRVTRRIRQCLSW
jgi:hypothetical protein